MQQGWKFSGSITDKLLCWSLLYIAALLPFQKPGVPLVAGIVVLTLAWIFSGAFKTKLQTVIADKKALLFVLLYIVYCIGFFYSSNSGYAYTDLLLKIPLLLFPLVISTSFLKVNRAVFLKTFFIASLLSAVFCLLQASYFTYTTGKNYFFYSHLSYFFHVGHYAMYLVFAAFIGLDLLFREHSRKMKLFYAASFVLLAITILLLSARAQLVAFLIIAYSGMIIFFFSQKKWLQGSLVLVVSAMLCIAVVQAFPLVKTRLILAKTEVNDFFSQEQKQYNAVSVRFMIWETGYQVIKKYPLFGTGTGDVKDELKKEATIKGYHEIVKKDLNYHNQYIQTMAAIGLPGLMLLLAAIITGFVCGVKKRDYVSLSFFTLIVVSFLTESLLERQTGVIFYSFFTAILIFADREKNVEIY